MASLEEIKTYLNIDLINKRLRDGKKHPSKNRFYYYHNDSPLLNYHRICR